GTRALATLDGNFDNLEPLFTRVGAIVFFRSPRVDGSLWRTDGTPQGTTVALHGSLVDGPFEDLVAFGGTLYFFQFVNGEGDALFRSDGTPAGTVRLQTFNEGIYGNSSHVPVVYGNHLVFVADDGVHGPEPWKTDGTAAGTVLIRDIFPGEPASVAGFFAEPFVQVGGQLYFTADDGAHGAELWETDATAAGTRLVHDLNPGAAASNPSDLTWVGAHLYFAADDGLLGYEPWFLTLGSGGGLCQAADTHLCLNGGRYRVEAQWKDAAGHIGDGHGVALSPDTGYFWFFSPTNVEAVLKVLDGRPLNGHFWVFYGALSNVEYSLTVTDTQSGLTRRYFNPQGNLASVGDTSAFGPRGAHARSLATAAAPPPFIAQRRQVKAAGACTPSSSRLCLDDGRFAVEAAWKDFAGHTGVGTPVQLTVDTGYFWFFDSSNVEVMLKVLDGRGVNNHFWVFFGALSNVEYTLTVTDTATGAVKIYSNPSGRFASVADTSAF
ncbi:MAG TPA: ELWxxDGT repeat protein, partial [Thermoanaerobaculia bacterium]|nr:ELWxxDGT repeat protein [Thermoanaerobaculia bacterium]